MVCTLAHVFDAAGIASVALVSNLPLAERLAPPRALYCDFPLGRPLGRPGDPQLQHRVLASALALLDRAHGPILETFGEVIEDEAHLPLACPLPPRHDPNEHPAVDEARGLRPAWERNRDRTGRTQVGRVVDADGVPDALRPFIEVAEGRPWTDVHFPGDPAALAMDIRSYYEEAALALTGHVPAARSSETWLYHLTETGKVLRRSLVAVGEADPPFPARDYLVPRTQTET